MCHVDMCCRAGIVVMDVRWRRLCMYVLRKEIYLFLIGQGCEECDGKILFRAAGVRCCCAPYLVIVSSS